MDTRKVTLIATIAAIVLVAVGIGYAYTASTLNSSNVANSEYVTLVQGDATATKGAYNFANGVQIDWDTVDEKNGSAAKTTFTFNTGATTEVIDGYTVVKVGKSFDVLTQHTGSATATPAASLNLSIEQDGFENDAVVTAETDDIFFFLKVSVLENTGEGKQVFYFKLTKEADVYVFKSCSESGVIPGSGAVSTFEVQEDESSDGITTYNTATIEVYYGYATTPGIVENHALNEQPDRGPRAAILDGASLTLKYYSTV